MSIELLSNQRAKHCYRLIEEATKQANEDTVGDYETSVAAMPAFLRNNGLLHFVAFLTKNQAGEENNNKQKKSTSIYPLCLRIIEEHLHGKSWTTFTTDPNNQQTQLFPYLLKGDIDIKEHMAIENEINELLVWMKSLLRAKKAMLAQAGNKKNTGGDNE